MLPGTRTVLREATEADRRIIYDWLAHSDVTPSLMGPPVFPEHPIPTWEEFCDDYLPHYFDGSKPHDGRCFIIVVEGCDVGVVCYNAIRESGTTDVDIWLRSEADCGRGIGSDALTTITDYLNREFSVATVAVSPSARNARAMAAYRKAGFHLLAPEQYSMYITTEQMEYEDNVVLVKNYAQGVERPNEPQAANPAIASQFAFVHRGRGVTGPGR